MGGEGKSESYVQSRGILGGSTEVADELVELLEREVCVP